MLREEGVFADTMDERRTSRTPDQKIEAAFAAAKLLSRNPLRA